MEELCKQTEWSLLTAASSLSSGTIYSGTSDIQRNRIAAMLGLGKPAKGPGHAG